MKPTILILFTEVIGWYEPVTDLNDEFNADRAFHPRMYDDSSYLNEYKPQGTRAQDGQDDRDADISLSDISEVINEYPQKDLSYQDKFIPIADDVKRKIDKMDELKDAINNKLETDGFVSGLHDRDAWNRLHKFLTLNFRDYIIDGHLSVELHIRYILCCYVVAFVPAEFAFFFPAFYDVFVPKKAHKIPILCDLLRGLDRFLKFVSDSSRKTFIITFYVGRRNSLLEDIDFIKKIPDLLFTDPLAILRELLKFEIRAEGYNNKKEL